MARRTSFYNTVKPDVKKEYFNSKYSLKSVTGMKKIGDEAYVLLLRPEEYLFQTEFHKVREKVHGKVGFKSLYDTNIICKRYDKEGNRAEEMPTCCFLADQLFKEAKEKARAEAVKLGLDPEDKRNLHIKSPMTFTGTMMHIPVLVLGFKGLPEGAKPSVSRLAIKDRRSFAFLEVNKKTYIKDIYNKLKSELVAHGDIDAELEGEELAAEMLGKIKTSIIKIAAVPPTGSVIYEKEYSFIPFSNKNIGSKTEEYLDIVNYEKNEEIEQEITDFLEIFELEVDKFFKDYTDEELTNYLIDKKEAKEDEEPTPQEEEEEVVLPPKPAPVANKAIADIMNRPAQPIVQKSEIKLSEEDTTFDSGEFLDDELEGFDVD